MRMQLLVRTVVLALGVSTSAVVAAAGLDGVWKTGEGESGGYLHVRFAPCGDEICGEILRAFDASGEAVEDYEHAGESIVRGMRSSAPNRWKSGTIWAPDTDKTYRSKMRLDGDVLAVSGCVFGGIICRTMDWTRVE